MTKWLFCLCVIGLSLGHSTLAKEQILNYVSVRAEEYGINEDKFIKLIACESGFTHFFSNGQTIKGDKGHSIGLLQFQKPTFNLYAPLFIEQFGRAPEITNYFDQIDLAMLMLADDNNNWRHWWNCSKRFGVVNYKLYAMK